MSATFWNRRRRIKALKVAEAQAEAAKIEPTETKPAKKTTKSTTKKNEPKA